MEYRDAGTLKPKFETETIISHEVMTKVREKIAWCLSTAANKGLAITNMPFIDIRATLTGQSTNGRAHCDPRKGIYRISIHSKLLMEETDKYLSQTLLHEVAHCIQRYLYPRSKSHGFEWVQVMGILGAPADRCTDYDSAPVRNKMARPYIYTCRCREHLLTHILHDRILQGRWRTCVRCKQRIAFKRVA